MADTPVTDEMMREALVLLGHATKPRLWGVTTDGRNLYKRLESALRALVPLDVLVRSIVAQATDAPTGQTME